MIYSSSVALGFTENVWELSRGPFIKQFPCLKRSTVTAVTSPHIAWHQNERYYCGSCEPGTGTVLDLATIHYRQDPAAKGPSLGGSRMFRMPLTDVECSGIHIENVTKGKPTLLSHLLQYGTGINTNPSSTQVRTVFVRLHGERYHGIYRYE